MSAGTRRGLTASCWWHPSPTPQPRRVGTQLLARPPHACSCAGCSCFSCSEPLLAPHPHTQTSTHTPPSPSPSATVPWPQYCCLTGPGSSWSMWRSAQTSWPALSGGRACSRRSSTSERKWGQAAASRLFDSTKSAWSADDAACSLGPPHSRAALAHPHKLLQTCAGCPPATACPLRSWVRVSPSSLRNPLTSSGGSAVWWVPPAACIGLPARRFAPIWLAVPTVSALLLA